MRQNMIAGMVVGCCAAVAAGVDTFEYSSTSFEGTGFTSSDVPSSTRAYGFEEAMTRPGVFTYENTIESPGTATAARSFANNMAVLTGEGFTLEGRAESFVERTHGTGAASAEAEVASIVGFYLTRPVEISLRADFGFEQTGAGDASSAFDLFVYNGQGQVVISLSGSEAFDHAATLPSGNYSITIIAGSIQTLEGTSGPVSSTHAATYNVQVAVAGGCPADFNQDGGVDGQDVDAFFLAWEAGEAAADVNEDGGTDGSDVGAFFAAWEAGGC